MRSSPLIIGISGKKRHGKDEIASALASRGVNRLAFADELKRFAMAIWDLSFEQLYGADEHKESVDERWGLTPRFIMQQFGTEVGRNIHDQTWVRRAFDIIDRAWLGANVVLPDLQAREFRSVVVEDPSVWAVPDVRFKGEAEAIKARGGVVIKVVRPSLVSKDTHASETGVDEVVEDHLIVNDGTLDDLRAKVAALADKVLA